MTEINALREHLSALSGHLTTWDARDDNQPSAEVNHAVGDAIDAIDALTRDLHALRQRLVSENRRHQDIAEARVDALLAKHFA